MSGSDLQSSSGTSHRQVFHTNLHYREVLATLRYGIEARKGLILFSGEAGTGKTTLIQRLAEELDPSVITILETDPTVNFTDLLNLLLRRLHPTSDGADTGSLVDTCKGVLRSYRDRGQIVCLIIDNAQQVDELTLEYLMETFFPAEAENSDRNLLQMVLAGRPPIREKLLHPWLRPLNPHLGLVCHLEPLSEDELGPFITDQLRACDFSRDSLDRDALRQVYAYTKGNPRLVSELTQRAAQLAEESSSRLITAETIANAASDVGLGEMWRSRKTNHVAMEFPSEPAPREESFDFETSEAATTDMLMQTFLRDTPKRGRGWLTGERWGKGARVILPLLLITALAIWLQRDLLTEQVKSWAEQITRVPAAPELSSANKAEPDLSPPPIEREPPLPPPPAAKPKPRAPEPSPPPPPENVDEGNSASADPLSGEETTPEVKSPAQRSPARPENGDQGSRAEPVERRNKQLEAAVEHAIRIRAIDGVEVSVVNGTAVLSGRVASERQKQAAERAANSVSGVQRVRNRIVVG